MKYATIKGFSRTWGSDIAMLELQVDGEGPINVPCKSDEIMLVLNGIFPGFTQKGLRVNSHVIYGRGIKFEVDDSGLLSGLGTLP